MALKQYIIIFLILFFLPVVLGKVSLDPFKDFLDHPSFNGFGTAFTTVLKADWNFYLGWLNPWIQKIKDLVADSIPQTP